MLAPVRLRLQADELRARVREVANAWPTVGLAVGVVTADGLELFHACGLADVEANRPVTEDTIFRIASVTKPFTAVCVMQLVDRGVLDLDAPANQYLRAFKLVGADPTWRPATLRHLLTHTAGIRELLHLRDLSRMRDLGETVRAGRRLPPLAEYYSGGLAVDAEPGTRFMYTNHGFNALGQVVEDVTGIPLATHLREAVFEPLGMTDSDLDRSRLERSRLATPYEVRSLGAERVPDYEVISRSAGGISSSSRDVARFVAALLRGGSILSKASVEELFKPQYQPDPRIPGMGLAFFRQSLGGHAVVEHDGILPGFDSQVYLAPGSGVGVIAFANGARRGMHWLGPHISRILCDLLGVAQERTRHDVPQRPELWTDLCGRYRFSAARTDPASLAFGRGAEVLVRRGQLNLRFRSPIPALRKGFVLHPDEPDDPHAFRAEFPWFGIRTARVVFSSAPGRGTAALHLDAGPMSFWKQD